MRQIGIAPEKEERIRKSLVHMGFMALIYRRQVEANRLFLHEHPQQATSWDEGVVKEVMDLPGVDYIDMHQCQYGHTDGQGDPVKKPTRWMSNSKWIDIEFLFF